MEKIPSVWIESLTFSDGTVMHLNRGEIVVFVGPNNSGKSAALRGLRNKMSETKAYSPVLKEVKVRLDGDIKELIDWVRQIARPDPGRQGNYATLDATAHVAHAEMYWCSKTLPGHREFTGLGEFSGFFCRYLDTENRLSAANPANNIALLREPRYHPIHHMQADDSLERRASEYFRLAFGQDLIVHRNAGKEVPLYCGEKPKLGPGEDRTSTNYNNELEELALLHLQGDGMRSFVGILLNAFIVRFSIVLIDEPEAFLHPPQARLLGQMLAKELDERQQLFIATHSGDFLRGLVDSNRGNCRVVRLKRQGEINKTCELDKESILTLWRDPLLRFSNVLDGLFHNKVIVCESDADCRFYGAIADALFENKTGDAKPDVMFTHCGGKDRIPVVVLALKKLGVPIVAIADFDILRDQQPLRTTYEALGGLWTEIEKDWKQVRSSIDNKKAEASGEDIKREIQGVLTRVSNATFPEAETAEIGRILKKSSPWAAAKNAGRAFVPNGDPTQAMNRLFSRLEEKGLFVVECGELERFVPSVPKHGPAWVNKALEKNLLSDPELEGARCFVSKFVSKNRK